MEVDGCTPGPGDPYEFDDEAMAAAAVGNRVDNFRATTIPNIKVPF